jgi:hypothetical protein
VFPLLPWVVTQAQLPATEWVTDIYNARPSRILFPRILQTLEILTPGAFYPPYAQFRFGPPLWRPGTFLLLAAVLSAGLFAAVWGQLATRRMARAGFVLMITPLVLMSLVSLVRPVYLIGRYDLIALPGLALLAGTGIALLHKVGQALIALMAALLTAASLAPSYGLPPEYASLSRPISRKLAPALRESDVLLFTGYSMPEVRYLLLRQGIDPRFYTIPLSTAEHPGWIDRRLLGDVDALRAEAASAGRAAAASARGIVWLIADPRAPGPQAAVEALEELGLRGIEVILLPDDPRGHRGSPLSAIAFAPLAGAGP